MKFAIIIVAAGSGTRFGSVVPKQYHSLQGKPVVAHSIERLHASFPNVPMVLVQHADQTHYTPPAYVQVVNGAATRQASVYAGLQALAGRGITHVLIHDAARPYVDGDVCARLTEALATHQAVIPALPVSDTVKRVSVGRVVETLDRMALVAVQTPQAFAYEMIYRLHKEAAEQGADTLTDDAGLCEAAGIPVATVKGASLMRKITHPEDMQHFSTPAPRFRVGMGYDVHRLLPFAADVPSARQVIRLGGIDVPHTHYLEGHSDADVVLHALTDALLGAIGEGDIGQHFPPSDMQFRQMDSARFVEHACALLAARGWILVNADITLIGERPKISPYRDAMRARIAEILGVESSAVNVKATTTERLGFEGKGEGLAAQAVVSVQV